MTTVPAPVREGRTRRLVRRALADETRSQKATLNMVASVLDYGARMLVGLLINPVLVSRLGDVAFGVYQSLTRLIGYATPAGGRPSQALKWTIARDQHSDRVEDKRLQVGSAVAVWFLFLPVLAVAGGALAWVAPLLLGLPPQLHLTVRVAAGVLVLDLILTNLLTIPQSVVQGENLGYKRMGQSMVIVFAGGVATAVAVVLGAGLVGVAACVVATTTATGLLYLRVARRSVAWFGMDIPPLREVGSFMRLSGWFLLWNLVMQLMRASDVVVLGAAGSPQLVTVYTLSRYVPEAIFGVVAIVISAIMPGLGGLMGARETKLAASVRSESMAVTWLLATAAGAAFLLWQRSFLGLWVGDRYFPGTATNLLIVLMVLQFAFIRNDASIIDLTLQLRGKVLLGIASAAVSIGLAVPLISVADLGITGLAIGFMTGRAIVGVAYPWLVCRALAISPAGQLAGAARPALFTAALFAGVLLIEPFVQIRAWPALVAAGIGSGAALALLAYAVGLSRTQRRRVSRRARSVLTR